MSRLFQRSILPHNHRETSRGLMAPLTIHMDTRLKWLSKQHVQTQTRCNKQSQLRLLATRMLIRRRFLHLQATAKTVGMTLQAHFVSLDPNQSGFARRWFRSRCSRRSYRRLARRKSCSTGCKARATRRRGRSRRFDQARDLTYPDPRRRCLS